MNFPQILQNLLDTNRLTNYQLAKNLDVHPTTVANWLSGKTPRKRTLGQIADYFGVTTDYLLGREPQSPANTLDIPGIEPLPKMKKVPLLGTIACGAPILAEQNIEDYVEVPETAKVDFCLRCKGESMINARILDGDIVFIKTQQDVENGEIAAVLVEDEATLKRVYKETGRLVLMAENPAIPPMIYSGDDLNHIRILGKASTFYSIVK